MILGLGCTGNIGSGPGGSGSGSSSGSGSGSSSGSGNGPGASGSGGSQGQGSGGQGPSGSGGQGSSGQGSGGQGPSGSGGATGGDPYAIPASPPAQVVVATSRLARLSRPQWSNAIRDLLKLSDITEIDRGVTGDALMGFDDDGDNLFVTEQLRQDLANAAEKLADKVTGDATA
ncbi:MAG TPA: DUF1587 domain-containing protein, partial [Polyangia bacterium]|nr:DUF1587 domain-containing protein [Polyangia bacterium]